MYDPKKHHRKSIRLKGYDYSQAGFYFITICCQDRTCLFGKVIHGKMVLNAAGEMIEKWYYELENKFPDIKCHEMIVMPNHFHCIIENDGAATVAMPVGADLRVCPNTNTTNTPILSDAPMLGDAPILGKHVGSPLHRVMQWFKTMTTNEYIRGVKNLGWQPFNGKIWQRNYYEHIIRNEQSYQRISEYIINNPSKWVEDRFHEIN